MKSNLSADPDYNLWVLLHQARDAIFRARDKELSQYGITTMQSAVLFIITALGGEATATEISRWLSREPHSVSGLLARMEREGLVRKVKDLVKKSQVNVTLTAKGRQAHSESLKRESLRGIMSCLTEEERQQLVSSLKQLRDKALGSLTKVRKLPFP